MILQLAFTILYTHLSSRSDLTGDYLACVNVSVFTQNEFGTPCVEHPVLFALLNVVKQNILYSLRY